MERRFSDEECTMLRTRRDACGPELVTLGG
jgi:hypothetical protein